MSAMSHTGEALPAVGVAFTLQEGDRLELIDPCGEQVADLFCVPPQAHQENPAEAGRVREDSVRQAKGQVLVSNVRNPLLRIVENHCGVHDFLVTPCSLHMFQMLNPGCKYHPSCQENLALALCNLGIAEPLISTSFKIFLNVPLSDTGGIKVLAPLTRAGDKIEFEALRELLVGLAPCSDGSSQNCKPIRYRLLRA